MSLSSPALCVQRTWKITFAPGAAGRFSVRVPARAAPPIPTLTDAGIVLVHRGRGIELSSRNHKTWACLACLTGVLAVTLTARAERLAVLEFSGDGRVDEAVLGLLADRVRTAAVRDLDADEWEIITRENMLELLDANAEDLAACIGQCEVETGQLIGADRIIAGSVVLAGTQYWVTLKAFDTRSGRLLASAEASAVDVEGLVGSLPDAYASLFAPDDDNPDDPPPSPPPGNEEYRRKLDELKRKQAEREAKEAEEERARKEAEEALARLLAERSAALLEAATEAWELGRSLRESGGPEAVEAVELFLGEYGDEKVTIDGEDHRVAIAQVSEAREWLERNAGRAARAATSGGLGGSVIDAHGYELVSIEPGEFWMGSVSDEEGRDDDETRHWVRLTRGFALGSTEGTQGLYRAVTGRNPSQEEYEGVSLVGDDKPVQKVRWLLTASPASCR